MTQATVIDGKAFAEGIRARVSRAVAELKDDYGVTPGLAVVLVGDDPASAVYVRNKGEQANAVGMHSVTHRLPAQTSQADLLDLVRQLNSDPSIHGVLVQMPLPKGLDADAVIAAIDPAKDVDGLHPLNAGRLSAGLPGLVPCTPVGCMLLLRDQLSDLSGLHAVMVGRSNLMGKPMAQLLLAANCTVTVAHSRTRDLASVCRLADILVVAVGQPEMVKADWIKPGATVLDVGMNRVPSKDPDKAAAGKTRLVGDVDFAAVSTVAARITPVPGGIGPMTIACLLRNAVQACADGRKIRLASLA
jgi:methylenetetrahydrofolate dehydrogenase (NADP+)/methenyltetrahydrofolate cyclohydrolase